MRRVAREKAGAGLLEVVSVPGALVLGFIAGFLSFIPNVGAVLLVFAQNYLQDLLAIANKALAGAPLLANLFHPDRWLLWLGVAFILCVYFFPAGIVGRLRQKR